MVYKDSPPYRVRPVKEIIEDLDEAAAKYGNIFSSLFFPAGNTIAMKTADLSDICLHARRVLPNIERITVYGSFQYIVQKGLDEMMQLKKAGLSRIHVGLESGDDITLKNIKKGTTNRQQVIGGQWVMKAGIELSLYVLLGIGGVRRSIEHAQETAKVLNAIGPDFIRLRTFLPKIHTPILQQIKNNSFQMLGPHQVLKETRQLIKKLECCSLLTSDHYTNYINLEGMLPQKKEHMIALLDAALNKSEESFRPIYIGNQ